MVATRNRQSPDVVSRLRLTLRGRLSEWLDGTLTGRHVAVAFSGGRDSVALLHALVALRAETGISLSALHIHHGLSANADRWVAFAQNFCKFLDVPLNIERVCVPMDKGTGIEGAARAERYRVFSESPAELLLLAHHQDDQAETLLFNLLRGAGVHGAAAMPMFRPLARSGGSALALGRPWLDVSRSEIDAYVAGCGLENIEDESNLDQAFSRNHLRHEIFPRLIDRYPQASASLANAARRFGDAASLLDDLADSDMAKVSAGPHLDWPRLNALSLARQKNLLRRFLVMHGAAISSEVAIDELLRQCRDASPDALIAMTFGALSLRRWQGRLYPVAQNDRSLSDNKPWDREASVSWCGGHIKMRLGVGDGLRADQLAGNVVIRSRQGSESIRLRLGGPSRQLRLLFQELGVPPWERPHLPFLWVGGRLAAVGSVGIAAEFLALPDDVSVSFEWCPG